MFKKELLLNPYIGITVALGLVIFGGYIAAIINYISYSEVGLWSFISSLTICFVILLSGFFFFLPYWSFRKKYYFLDQNYENQIAQKVVSVYNRSNKALTTFDGINAIQFFRIETHTDDQHVLYNFKKIFSVKSKYFNLSGLKEKKIEVPIAFFEWLNEPTIPAPDNGDVINELLYEWLVRRSEDDPKFNEIIENWEIQIIENPKIMSIHYHVLFEPKDPVDIQKVETDIDSVFEMEYNGVKEYHRDRGYYSTRVFLTDLENGGYMEGILLVIGNNRRIDLSKIKQVVTGILKG
ncbi:hypothetical protein [Halobacillus litoralis]|uniref:hypothetical protein n=1 Tax=Halobacillus litoralis TaxID=45668 RepID=UPI001CFE40A5|nr:hypothetical protein [Halobacillus litoralis]